MRILLALVLAALFSSNSAAAGRRLDTIQQRGFVTCGIEAEVPGFAEVDAQGATAL